MIWVSICDGYAYTNVRLSNVKIFNPITLTLDRQKRQTSQTYSGSLIPQTLVRMTLKNICGRYIFSTPPTTDSNFVLHLPPPPPISKFYESLLEIL